MEMHKERDRHSICGWITTKRPKRAYYMFRASDKAPREPTRDNYRTRMTTSSSAEDGKDIVGLTILNAGSK